ncbi:uncharacterized protein CLAFUR5_03407 [Fulvia fulva]|uniref:Uncharacterized protein n=1 Tax=Passalora fulva TaxID=5499 RepID=A0A9Q8P4M1_PASFU|nr:uncharacterized protein CLAFUR5_03407 [Fulvia fulva]UJO13108.1 hypothetical protein CLAFUR5_03407 [Fulvia fulva]
MSTTFRTCKYKPDALVSALYDPIAATHPFHSGEVLSFRVQDDGSDRHMYNIGTRPFDSKSAKSTLSLLFASLAHSHVNYGDALPVFYIVGSDITIGANIPCAGGEVTLSPSASVLTIDYGNEAAGVPFFEVAVLSARTQIELKCAEDFAALNILLTTFRQHIGALPSPAANTMATFSQRKVQRLKDLLMHEATDSELHDIRDFLNKRPKKIQTACGLLKLPAELRYIIYEHVAEDAHAMCPKPIHEGSFQLEQRAVAELANERAMHLRDSFGGKVRPGLLGACKELFQEFHSIFYSSAHIDARLYYPGKGWRQVNAPAMLDYVVNDKHNVRLFSASTVYFGSDNLLDLEMRIETYVGNAMFWGILRMRDADNAICGVRLGVAVKSPPWSDRPYSAQAATP